MIEQDHDPLPEDLARHLADDAEREALGAVWQALPAARPRPAVAGDERNAMWAAIAAATSPAPVAAGDPDAARLLRVVRPTEVTRAPRTAARAASSVRPAWATRSVRAVAALAALLLVSTVTLARPGAWNEAYAPRGESRTLLLPDSTRVVLDADSRVRYRSGFRGWFRRASSRDVQLLGSGYFDVRRDGRPFVVTTYNARVRVLGTAFSVDAWEREATGTAVHVAEGRVAVNGAVAGETILGAGERAIVSHEARTAGPATTVAADRVAPWRAGGFSAIDEPLGAVLPAIARRYGVQVQVADSIVNTRRITLYVADANADRLLGDIATMQGLVLERRRDGYLLRTP